MQYLQMALDAYASPTESHLPFLAHSSVESFEGFFLFVSLSFHLCIRSAWWWSYSLTVHLCRIPGFLWFCLMVRREAGIHLSCKREWPVFAFISLVWSAEIWNVVGRLGCDHQWHTAGNNLLCYVSLLHGDHCI